MYFFINWFAAFCLPISIELLRLESILWTVLGLIFFYHGYKKILGTSATAISIILVISQLLLDCTASMFLLVGFFNNSKLKTSIKKTTSHRTLFVFYITFLFMPFPLSWNCIFAPLRGRNLTL